MQIKKIVIVGGGPAGLMTAYQLLQLEKNARAQNKQVCAFEIHLYDSMPNVGRKFLLAGIGGLNLTHSEPKATFDSRYSNSQNPAQLNGNCPTQVQEWLNDFGAVECRKWAADLGITTFVGSSGRVFPKK